MSWISDAFTQGSPATGAGLPWGAGGQKGAFWDAISSGKQTPWAAGDQKGIQGLGDPVSKTFMNNGLAGNVTDTMDNALWSGTGTPLAAGGEKSMSAFMDPGLRKTIQNMGGDSGAAGQWLNAQNAGTFDMLGMGSEMPKEPGKPTLYSDPSQFKSPDYSDYAASGRAAINKKLAQDRLGAAAGLQKGGALGSGDTGLAFNQIDESGQEQRGGLANAIANMQSQNQWQQMQQANQNLKDQYSNDWDKYKDATNKRMSNRDTSMKTLGTVGTAALSFL